MAFTEPPSPRMPGETLGLVLQTRQRRHHGVVIFLKTLPWLMGRGRCDYWRLGTRLHCRCWLLPWAWASGA